MLRSLSKATVLMLLASSMNTYARTEAGTYVGLDLTASMFGEANTDSSRGNDQSGDLGASSGSLSIGYRSESNNRIQLSLAKLRLEHESGLENDVSGIDLDWHIAYGDDAIQPYWGFGFGFYNMDDSSDYFINDNDLQGTSFQVMAGMKYDLNRRFELDLSYRIKSIIWQEMLVSNGTSIDNVQLSHTLSSLNLGMAVKF
ncbi:MAG: porin family protein [Oleispira sp.]|nr:porin family protein [Oleispira sp.]MBL4880324.1 porin family protein [Oleispira sp.]